MKKIKSFYFKGLRNAEHFQLHWSIVSFLKNLLASGINGLVLLWNEYLAIFNIEDEVYKQSLKAEETNEIREADEKRDMAFKMIKLSVDAATLSENAEMRTAGKKLKHVFDNYKNIHLKPYLENTALVTNLVQDLLKPLNVVYVERLNLTEAVETLSEKNEAFEILYNERSIGQHDKQTQGKMYDIRLRVDKKYSALMNGIEALYVSNELIGKNAETRALLTTIIDTINSYIEQMERVYNRRVGGKNGKRRSDNKDEDENLQESIPHLLMTDQNVIGDSPIVSGFGTQTTAKAADVEAFNAALYPIATGGVVKLPNDSGDWENFPIAGFLMDESNLRAVGFILDPPNTEIAFNKPFSASGEATGEVYTGDQLLATLEGLSFPAYIRES
jgi:curved DNA-binding protein CbpA